MAKKAKRKNPILQVVLALGCVALLIGALRNHDRGDEVAATAELDTATVISASAGPDRVSDEECRKDIDCWTTRHELAASDVCADAIEAQAQYQVEWQDGLSSGKFSGARWAARDMGHLMFVGESVKFQNGVGAWQTMAYQCDYDPGADKVLEVRVKPAS
jgi:hypothetical protein